MQSLTAFLLAIILALAIAPTPEPQKKSLPEEKMECGTVVSPEQIKAELARRAELARNNVAPLALAPSADAPYYLPLTIHMAHDDFDILGGLSPEDMEAAMQRLNQLFQPVGIQFFIYGEIDHSIKGDVYYFADTREKQDALLRVNAVPNTINVYFAFLGKLDGRGTFTWDSVQGVLLSDFALSKFGKNRLEVFAHEMGHFFNLFHTHEKAAGVECPNGSNCEDAGDLLCDTPADPDLGFPLKVDFNCVYNNSVAPPGGTCGDTPYTPSTTNLMSNSRGECKNQFTTKQISRMLAMLSHDNRKNLIDGWKFYVDPQASSSNTKCTSTAPCRTVEKAVQAAQSGAVIYLKPGVHKTSSLGGKRLTLMRWGNSGVAELKP